MHLIDMRLVFYLGIFLSLACCGENSLAQDSDLPMGDTIIISGRLIDIHKEPIKGAKVNLWISDYQEVISDKNGKFEFIISNCDKRDYQYWGVYVLDTRYQHAETGVNFKELKYILRNNEKQYSIHLDITLYPRLFAPSGNPHETIITR